MEEATSWNWILFDTSYDMPTKENVYIYAFNNTFDNLMLITFQK